MPTKTLRKKKHKRAEAPALNDEPLRLSSIAEEHGITLRALMRYVTGEAHPPLDAAYKFGQSWFIRRSHFLAWLERCRQNPPKKPPGRQP